MSARHPGLPTTISVIQTTKRITLCLEAEVHFQFRAHSLLNAPNAYLCFWSKELTFLEIKANFTWKAEQSMGANVIPLHRSRQGQHTLLTNVWSGGSTLDLGSKVQTGFGQWFLFTAQHTSHHRSHAEKRQLVPPRLPSSVSTSYNGLSWKRPQRSSSSNPPHPVVGWLPPTKSHTGAPRNLALNTSSNVCWVGASPLLLGL